MDAMESEMFGGFDGDGSVDGSVDDSDGGADQDDGFGGDADFDGDAFGGFDDSGACLMFAMSHGCCVFWLPSDGRVCLHLAIVYLITPRHNRYKRCR